MVKLNVKNVYAAGGRKDKEKLKMLIIQYMKRKAI